MSVQYQWKNKSEAFALVVACDKQNGGVGVMWVVILERHSGIWRIYGIGYVQVLP
jgi:hypothetical protein